MLTPCNQLYLHVPAALCTGCSLGVHGTVDSTAAARTLQLPNSASAEQARLQVVELPPVAVIPNFVVQRVSWRN